MYKNMDTPAVTHQPPKASCYDPASCDHKILLHQKTHTHLTNTFLRCSSCGSEVYLFIAFTILEGSHLCNYTLHIFSNWMWSFYMCTIALPPQI